MYARIEAMTRPGYDRWRVMVERTGGCEEPIRLIGSCSVAHAPDDPSIGQALCPSCYDYEGVVLWNAQAGDLWRRTTLYLRTGRTYGETVEVFQLDGVETPILEDLDPHPAIATPEHSPPLHDQEPSNACPYGKRVQHKSAGQPRSAKSHRHVFRR
jgi:hypothetical protein